MNKTTFLMLKIAVVIVAVIFVLSFAKVFVLAAGLVGGYYLATIVRKFQDTSLASTAVKAMGFWAKVKHSFSKKSDS